MYYAYELFVKKGPLSSLWLAGTRGKLSRTAIMQSKIQVLCNSIAAPPVQLALPTQSTLLKGVCVIESKQIAYLYTQAIEANSKLRITKPSPRDLPDMKHRGAAAKIDLEPQDELPNILADVEDLDALFRRDEGSVFDPLSMLRGYKASYSLSQSQGDSTLQVDEEEASLASYGAQEEEQHIVIPPEGEVGPEIEWPELPPEAETQPPVEDTTGVAPMGEGEEKGEGEVIAPIPLEEEVDDGTESIATQLLDDELKMQRDIDEKKAEEKKGKQKRPTKKRKKDFMDEQTELTDDTIRQNIRNTSEILAEHDIVVHREVKPAEIGLNVPSIITNEMMQGVVGSPADVLAPELLQLFESKAMIATVEQVAARQAMERDAEQRKRRRIEEEPLDISVPSLVGEELDLELPPMGEADDTSVASDRSRMSRDRDRVSGSPGLDTSGVGVERGRARRESPGLYDATRQPSPSPEISRKASYIRPPSPMPGSEASLPVREAETIPIERIGKDQIGAGANLVYAERFRRMLDDEFNRKESEGKEDEPLEFESVLQHASDQDDPRHAGIPPTRDDRAISFMQLLLLRSLDVVSTQQDNTEANSYQPIMITKGHKWHFDLQSQAF